MNRKIEVLPDRPALIARSLEIVLSKLETAIQERGQFTIALSGGGTPKPLYEAIATQQLPWDKIHVFWGDERYVSPDHPDSNQLMARHAWLDKVDIPPSNIHPMPTGHTEPIVAAAEYEKHLQEFFHTQSGEFPALDVTLLGMGDDAHTASLFPHTEALNVCDHLITVGNKDGQPRLTFTLPLLDASRCVIFIVSGKSKRPALERVFAPEADNFTYPSRFVQPSGELLWLLDADAGGDISTTTSK